MSPLARLIVAMFTGRRPQGSAITFGVSRNCLFALAPDCIERVLSRDRILEGFLNDAYLGHGAYGVAAGAAAYFGKPLERLDIDEIAFLVARLRVPYPNSATRSTRDRLIDKIHAAGLIDEQQTATAKAAPLPWLDNQPRDL